TLRSAQLALGVTAAIWRNSEPGELVIAPDMLSLAIEPIARLALSRCRRLGAGRGRRTGHCCADARELEEAASIGDRLLVLLRHLHLHLASPARPRTTLHSLNRGRTPAPLFPGRRFRLRPAPNRGRKTLP